MIFSTILFAAVFYCATTFSAIKRHKLVKYYTAQDDEEVKF